jgi:hypothetical protein
MVRWFAWIAVVLAIVVPVRSNAQTEEQKIDPKAQELLLKMTAYLRFAQSFSFTAEIARDDVLPTGQKIERGGEADFIVRRPNRLQATYDSDRRDVKFYYDGTDFTMVEPDKNVYGVIPAPSNIDDLVKMIQETYGFSLPMGDLVSTDLYLKILKGIKNSSDLGLSKIRGVSCHHLSFTLETIDLQFWIAEGKQPVPCKFVITYKNETSSPEYAAILSNWDFGDRPPDDPIFTVQLPPNSNKVDFIPDQTVEEEP